MENKLKGWFKILKCYAWKSRLWDKRRKKKKEVRQAKLKVKTPHTPLWKGGAVETNWTTLRKPHRQPPKAFACLVQRWWSSWHVNACYSHNNHFTFLLNILYILKDKPSGQHKCKTKKKNKVERLKIVTGLQLVILFKGNTIILLKKLSSSQSIL
jgi:hypothetical protein